MKDNRMGNLIVSIISFIASLGILYFTLAGKTALPLSFDILWMILLAATSIYYLILYIRGKNK